MNPKKPPSLLGTINRENLANIKARQNLSQMKLENQSKNCCKMNRVT